MNPTDMMAQFRARFEREFAVPHAPIPLPLRQQDNETKTKQTKE